MKHKSIIKALLRAGFKPEILEEKKFDNLVHYKCYVKGVNCSARWFFRIWINEAFEEGCSPYVLNKGSEDCLITDYFPGYYPETIKQLIVSLKNGG